MKEINIFFKDVQDAKYYCRCLAVEYEKVFSKGAKNELIFTYTDKHTFFENILIKLGIKKEDYKSAKLFFRSIYLYDNPQGLIFVNDIEISDLYKKILNECRKNG